MRHGDFWKDMKVKSHFHKHFYSDRLSKTKQNEFYSLALRIYTVKNYLSCLVNKNLADSLNMTKIEFQKHYLPFIKNLINSNFVKQIEDDVFTSYQGKFEAIKKKIEFKQIYDYKFTFHTRSSKYHKKGDFKKISKKYKSTALTITLTYLAKFDGPNPLEYLKTKLLKETNAEKKNFYNTMVNCIEKFGLYRLQKLALSKRTRIIKYYSQTPIAFKSLTFRGRSRLSSHIVSYNKNFNSLIKAFINISWGFNGRKKMTIPVKYAKCYHLDMKRYTNNTDTSYTVSFEENNQIRISLSYEDERFIPENKSNFVGIDVNSKHNLVQCSNGDIVDYDRELIKTLSKELLKIDKLKSKDANYVIGKRRNRKIKHLSRELQSKVREQIASLCKKFNTQSIDHAIFENLTGFKDKCTIIDDNNINYNRRIKILRLASIKNEFERIAKKYDIATSFVHSYYTSVTCPICGYIDKNNRKSQEIFICQHCSFTDNANLNASRNILHRVISTELRNELLKKIKTW